MTSKTDSSRCGHDVSNKTIKVQFTGCIKHCKHCSQQSKSAKLGYNKFFLKYGTGVGKVALIKVEDENGVKTWEI